MSDEEGNEAAYTYATFGKGAPPSPKGTPMPNEQTESQSDVERDALALAMFAAWLNVRVDQIPPENRVHTCKATQDAWQRVADAALSTLARDPQGLVEALRRLLNALDSCVDLTPEVIASARNALAAWEAGK
jgi:hypothetical protein